MSNMHMNKGPVSQFAVATRLPAGSPQGESEGAMKSEGQTQ